MKRSTLIALLIAAAVAAGAIVMYRQHSPTVPATPAVIDRTPAAPDMPVGVTCSVTCPDASTAEITCAQGEKPVCDCAATPRTQCLPPG